MTKIVYNACYGGFVLSEAATDRYWELKGVSVRRELCNGYATWILQSHNHPVYVDTEDRTDPCLVQVVEELGPEASGECSRLLIEELSPGTLYRIEEYDGLESVTTQDEYQWSVA